ncbi:hypothetical protein HOLleu_43486 [Holothuria leucospilota]|uniref:Myb/SANT-like DNA-binding domain-containing protein n=1 Tax=Holothuria leucospilota TaxID=206669 RepID=A0A9Q0YDQ7_HOLLE|nr:hypothetical protein HOLleu_43486 [Holothuria leucospilota]
MASSENWEKGEKKQTRQRRWMEGEVILLANLVKARREHLFGTSEGFGVEKRKRKMWEEVAERVKVAGGDVDRGGWESMRKKWTDVSFRAKKYKKDRLGVNKTGGGPQPLINPAMEAVLDALPCEVTGGIVPIGVCETVPEMQDSPQTQIGREEQTKSQVDLTKEAGPSGVHKPAQCAMDGNSQSSTSSGGNSQGARPKKRKREENSKKRSRLSKDPSLLDLNNEMILLEKTKIEIQRQILETLKQISNNISKLIPEPDTVDLLTSMISEQ